MVSAFALIVPYLVLGSHILFVMLFVAVLGRRTWGEGITRFLGKHALVLGFLISLGSIIGSLFYSEVIGFEACILCWWQRVFLYSIAPVMAWGLWSKRFGSAVMISVILALLALLVGGYQEISNLTGASLLTCTGIGGACSKVFVKEFGYITIPVMSITVSAYILLLAWAYKIYHRR